MNPIKYLFCLIRGHQWEEKSETVRTFFPHSVYIRHFKRCKRCGKIIK